jgi:hypothetical protein
MVVHVLDFLRHTPAKRLYREFLRFNRFCLLVQLKRVELSTLLAASLHIVEGKKRKFRIWLVWHPLARIR